MCQSKKYLYLRIGSVEGSFQAPMISSEQQLWKRIKQGDEAAYEELFRQFYGALCQFAFGYLKNEEESKEIVQEVFMGLWEKRQSLKIKKAVKTYLFQAVRNGSLNRLRHEKVRQMYHEHQRNRKPIYDADEMERQELQLKIDKALDSLPERCQEIFRLSRYEDLKYREIADLLNISIKTVEIQMGKALKIMRSQLQEYLPIFLCIFFLEKIITFS